jgi:hypothetical protein
LNAAVIVGRLRKNRKDVWNASPGGLRALRNKCDSCGKFRRRQFLHLMEATRVAAVLTETNSTAYSMPRCDRLARRIKFRFFRRANHPYILCHPVPLEGALAIVTRTLGRELRREKADVYPLFEANRDEANTAVIARFNRATQYSRDICVQPRSAAYWIARS